MTLLSLNLFLGSGKALALGAVGFSVLQVNRQTRSWQSVVESGVVTILSLTFYQSFFTELSGLAGTLESSLSGISKGFELGNFLSEQVELKSKSSDGLAWVTEMLKIGVWSVIHLVVDFLFIVSSILLRAASEVMWNLLLLFVPVAAGLYSVFPSLLTNVIRYGIEVSLWNPMMILVELVTGDVARSILSRPGSSGLTAIAIELVSVMLTFSIPAVTHKILAGSLSSDLGVGGAYDLSKRWLKNASGVTTSGRAIGGISK